MSISIVHNFEPPKIQRKYTAMYAKDREEKHYRYYVEGSEGGGIEFAGDTLEEVMKYIQSVGGVLEYAV